MNRLLMLALMMTTAAFGLARVQAPCAKGGQVVVTNSASSTTKVQASYPACTVTVYNAGTVVKPTIYSDNSGTVKANPFTADSTGWFYFYVADGYYDVTLSGGGLSAPWTYGGVNVIDAYFKRSATNAVSRLKSDKEADIVSVLDFGAKCDGSTDDSNAINSAVTALPTGGGTVLLPACALPYKVASSITDGGKSVAFQGQGISGTTVEGTAIKIFKLTQSFSSVVGMTIQESSSTPSASTIGISIEFGPSTGLSQVRNVIRQVRLLSTGTDPAVGDVAGTAVKVLSAIEGTIADCSIERWNKGIAFYGDGNYTPPTHYGPANSWQITANNLKFSNTAIYLDTTLSAFGTEWFFNSNAISGNDIGIDDNTVGGAIMSAHNHYEQIYGTHKIGIRASKMSIVSTQDEFYDSTYGIQTVAGNSAIQSLFGSVFGLNINHNGSGIMDVYSSPYLSGVSGTGAALVYQHLGDRMGSWTLQAFAGSTRGYVNYGPSQGTTELLQLNLQDVDSAYFQKWVRFGVNTHGIRTGAGANASDIIWGSTDAAARFVIDYGKLLVNSDTYWTGKAITTANPWWLKNSDTNDLPFQKMERFGVATHRVQTGPSASPSDLVHTSDDPAAKYVIDYAAGTTNTGVVSSDIGMRAIPVTVTNLQACNAGTTGLLQVVTDSSVNTWGSTVSAGGSNKIMAWCNGTAWTVIGK